MDGINIIRYVVAFIFVIGLMMLLGWAARRFMPGAIPLKTTGRNKRLSLVDVLPIDTKRRAVLIRRDTVEHLILLGQNDEIIIERDITPPLDADTTSANNDT